MLGQRSQIAQTGVPYRPTREITTKSAKDSKRMQQQHIVFEPFVSFVV